MGTVVLDVNGDIAALIVERKLSVELNVAQMQEKMTAKYGDQSQVATGAEGKVESVMRWELAYNGKMPRMVKQESGGMGMEMIPKSTMSYQMSCNVALRASGEHATAMKEQIQSKILSLRKETGVIVDV